MFDQIRQGRSPSAVFRQVLETAPALTNRQLASLFYEEFSELDSVAIAAHLVLEVAAQTHRASIGRGARRSFGTLATDGWIP
jgi:hypothetical protein